eukprot:6073741-Pyramimonas_sp.AAC.1
MQRHTIATIRKADLCSCACRGMCTIGAIMSVVVWSLNVLASGVFPELAHDGTPFHSEWRHNVRGFPLAEGLCGALVEMRADLLEFVSALGFRRWDNVLNP